MAIQDAIFRRSELLLGDEAMERIAQKRVIIFGVGGVGSWCAESLVRSGIRLLTIVDSDRVCITNINRQLMATTKTVGQVKVEALKERLLSINPSAEISALQKIFSQDTAESTTWLLELMSTDLHFLPQVASINIPFAFASWTIRFTGAESGATTATSLSALTRFPKPILISFILPPKLLYILNLLADFFNLALDVNHLVGKLRVLNL